MADGATAAGLRRSLQRNAQRIENPQGGGVDVGRQRRLHTAGQQQHAPRVKPIRHDASGLCRGQDAQHPPQRHSRREQGAGEPSRKQSPGHARERGPRQLFVHQLPSGIEHAAVLHARRTGRLAGAAGQTAIQVQPRPGGGAIALEHLFDEIQPATRAIELIAQDLVGRAGRRTEATVHTAAQQRGGLLGIGAILERGREGGLHKGAIGPGSTGRD